VDCFAPDPVPIENLVVKLPLVLSAQEVAHLLEAAPGPK
jgi:hypothetical protein